jgi:hypothetical protein
MQTQVDSTTLGIERRVEEVSGCSRGDVAALVQGVEHPLLLRGLVDDWPVVQRGRESAEAAFEHIASFYRGRPVSLFLGEANIGGRFFYNDTLSGFNFLQMDANLNDVLGKLVEYRQQDEAPCFYVGSTAVDNWLPGFSNQNPMPLPGLDPLISIWIGNSSRVAAHFDFPENIACCALGRRRFTVFPPEQIGNLYVGPMDLTPAGQQISLVDFHDPDYSRFPRFEQALESALVAELEPGDALFLPGMWWHHVEALDAVNVLVNYWWSLQPASLGSPADALNHALLSIKSLPPAQRRAWRALFDYYVFDAPEAACAHIPEAARGRLGEIDDAGARRLRAELMNQLKR